MSTSEGPSETRYRWKDFRGTTALSPLRLDVYVFLLESKVRGGPDPDLDAVCAGLPTPATSAPMRAAVGSALDDVCEAGLAEEVKAAAAPGPSPAVPGATVAPGAGARGGSAVAVSTGETPAHCEGAGPAVGLSPPAPAVAGETETYGLTERGRTGKLDELGDEGERAFIQLLRGCDPARCSDARAAQKLGWSVAKVARKATNLCCGPDPWIDRRPVG